MHTLTMSVWAAKVTTYLIATCAYFTRGNPVFHTKPPHHLPHTPYLWHTARLCGGRPACIWTEPFARGETTLPHTTSTITGAALGQSVRTYRCQCGEPIFFRNSTCLTCNTPLGYHPEQARLLPLKPVADTKTWTLWEDDGQTYLRCANLHTPASCNWLVPAASAHLHQGLCRACRLNRTIPDLADPKHPDNGELWGRVELAKRRLVSALLVMGLPVASRETEDTKRGVMFDFLRSPTKGPHVMTGHNDGLITLNIDEANHAHREAARQAMDEPYRTLVGHFRHEIGHYYWDRLVWDTPWLEKFRALFGDENQDYAASLKENYENGPRPDWPQHFVSAYASVHPWEDWAECWAHYMHMLDTVDSAQSFGLTIDSTQIEFTPFTADWLYQCEHPDSERFLAFLNRWTLLTMMLNGMSRAMGQPDFYPFVLPHEAVTKLHFIHLLVLSSQEPVPAASAASVPAQPPAPASASQSQSQSSTDTTVQPPQLTK
jgi:hypothetical protein